MNKKRIIIALVCLILIGFGVVLSLVNSEEEDYIPNTINNNKNYNECIIEIKGEVNRPGIYVVNESYCINDCLILAGGLTKNADVASLNLASRVSDGLLIVITSKVENTEEKVNKISINKATVSELTSISGIGTVIANNIVEYRNKNGYFKSIEELLNVDRVSESLLSKIKEYITL